MATYYGDENDNVISGSASADQIYGYGGNDYLLGGDGDDYLSGGDGGDSLSGGAGNDTLDGGNGADILAGGAGDDTYIVDNVSDIVAESSGGNEGIDTLQSSVSYTLGTNLENLTLTGTAAINGTGNGLDNILTGNSAANLLNGGNGNDWLDGGAGADTLAGGDGNDTYVVDDADDAVTETNADTAQIDTVQSAVSYTLAANVENLTLTGTAAINGTGNSLANTITGNGAANLLNAGLGNDWLDGGAGADTLTGGDGNDTYLVDDAGDSLVENSGEGIDTVQSSLANYTLGANLDNLQLLGTGNLNGTGNGLNNLLYANSGDNILDGGAGTDTISYQYGTTSSVTVSLATTTAQATGGSGSDTLLNIENLTGSAYADTLTGNSAANVLNGDAGADTLTGGDGNDTYVVDDAGDAVTETNVSTTQIDTVQSAVTYTLGANVENLVLTGTAALDGTGNSLANTITGNSGANVLDGGNGSDWLDGGTGADTLIGGMGNDLYVVDDAGDVVVEDNPGNGGDGVYSQISYTLGAGVENLVLTGTADINGTGNDLINALYANSGNNVLNGGGGLDTVSYQYGATAGVTVSLAVTTAQATCGSGCDTLVSIESLVGSSYADTLTGNAGYNGLTGGAGADTMAGGGSNDSYGVDNAGDVVVENAGEGTDLVYSSIDYTLGDYVENLQLLGTVAINGTGNGLDNVVTGDSHANVLDGGLGNDWLNGANGADTLIGGTGSDSFVFGTITGGADTVQDFLSGTDGLRFQDGAAALAIGDEDHAIDNATVANAPDDFSNQAELVVVTPDIVGTITATSAAAAIGSASAAYTVDDIRLFAVDDGTDSALYWFRAADADAAVEANELNLIGTLQATASTALADYTFA
jgi:Ca2+-binding RTX toxin-like protein